MFYMRRNSALKSVLAPLTCVSRIFEQTAWRHEGKGPHCANLRLRTKIKQAHSGWSSAPESNCMLFNFHRPLFEMRARDPMHREGKIQSHSQATQPDRGTPERENKRKRSLGTERDKQNIKFISVVHFPRGYK